MPNIELRQRAIEAFTARRLEEDAASQRHLENLKEERTILVSKIISAMEKRGILNPDSIDRISIECPNEIARNGRVTINLPCDFIKFDGSFWRLQYYYDVAKGGVYDLECCPQCSAHIEDDEWVKIQSLADYGEYLYYIDTEEGK